MILMIQGPHTSAVVVWLVGTCFTSVGCVPLSPGSAADNMWRPTRAKAVMIQPPPSVCCCTAHVIYAGAMGGRSGQAGGYGSPHAVEPVIYTGRNHMQKMGLGTTSCRE